MRKKVWGCAVASAVLAVGGGLAVDYACYHPDSWVGRCFFTAQDVAVAQVRTMQSTQSTAEFAFRGMQGLLGQGSGAACEHEKYPVSREAMAEADCHVDPAVLPGSAVVLEDGAVVAAEPMPPVRDIVEGLPAVGSFEESEDVLMPAVEDDSARMPRVDDPASGKHQSSQTSTNSVGTRPACCEPKCATGQQPSAPAMMPACDDHPVPHHRKTKEHRAAGEESEPLLPKMRLDGGEKPRHFDIDTLEIRPGDLWFFDFTGPF
jgi:hypothetical protein